MEIRRRYNVRRKNEVCRCRTTSAEKRQWEHCAGGNLSEWLRKLANEEVARKAKNARKMTVSELLEERMRT